MSVTIRDVAQRAGVSISTVSRVLNDSSPVREEKKKLVLEAAATLGYTPNPAALSLLGKRTGAVGALLPFVNGEFFSELLSGLDEAAQALGLVLVVSTSHRQPSEFQRAVQTLDKRVDGLVVMAPELDAAAASSLLSDAPTVFLNTDAEGLDADAFNFDNAGGSRALTEHLIGLGHRRIALAAGPPEAWDARERVRGYRETMAEAGLPTREVPSGYTREAGAAAARQILDGDEPVTAILAPNDDAALGVVAALHEAGLRVPEDVSVTGFDGTPGAAYAVPPLTTARVSIRELGAWAVQRLQARIDRPTLGPAERVVVPVACVVGRSTGPPALGS